MSEIFIDTPSTGDSVGRSFTAAGTVDLGDKRDSPFWVRCTLTPATGGPSSSTVGFPSGTEWSVPLTATVAGSPYSLLAELFLSDPGMTPTSAEDADTVIDITVVGNPPVVLDDVFPDGPRLTSAAEAAITTRSAARIDWTGPTQAFNAVGRFDTSTGAVSVILVVEAGQRRAGHDKEERKHRGVVDTFRFRPTTNPWYVTGLHVPSDRRYAVHAVALDASGNLLGTSTLHKRR